MFVLIFATTFVRDISHSKKNGTRCDTKCVPVFTQSARSSRNFHFLDKFSKNTQISNFMKIRPVEAELFHADGQTDTANLIVAFRDFANALKEPRASVLPRPSIGE